MSLKPLSTQIINGYEYAEYGAETYPLDSGVYFSQDAPTLLARKPIESRHQAELVGVKFLGGVALLSSVAQNSLSRMHQQYAVLRATGADVNDIAYTFYKGRATVKTQLADMSNMFDKRPANASHLLSRAKINDEHVFDIPQFDNEEQLSDIRQRLSGLSERESAIARALGSGFGNIDIVKAYRVQPATVKTHLENIYYKMGVHTRTLVAAACIMDDPAIRENLTLDSSTRNKPLADERSVVSV
jgi:DNA-binding CsgD family transcriptional regulator